MKNLYFMGIGGSAMGAVAGAMTELGFTISGSDTGVYPPMSDFLKECDIRYFEGYHEENIKEVQPDTIVVGNSVSRGNPELEYALDQRITLVSMSKIVKKYLIARHTSIVITGTHGKTTTSSLTAWLLESAGASPGFLIGGIPQNFLKGCRASSHSEGGFFVSEGDEYDTAFFDKRSKFLHYRPDIAILNNIEFDHADIFSSLEDIKRSFRHFVRLIPRSGLLLAASDDQNVRDVLTPAYSPVQTFGLTKNAWWRAIDIEAGSEGTAFTLLREGQETGRFMMPMAGEHNIKNALAALAVGLHSGFAVEQLQKGLASFLPPKRRMEVIAEKNGMTVIDDFAHHPTAIRVTLDAVRQRYPGRRIIACFEPRSNTTTRNIFQEELTDCFAQAHIVVLGAVNRPDRYAPAERLNVPELLHRLTRQGKTVYAVSEEEGKNPQWGEAVYTFLSEHAANGDVIILLSNGDFGGLRAMLVNGFPSSL